MRAMRKVGRGPAQGAPPESICDSSQAPDQVRTAWQTKGNRVITIPIKTVSGMNAREHYMARSKRVKKEREAVAWALNGVPRPLLPCSVMLTRMSYSSGLDDDNLRSALKGVRDQVAEWIGVDDRYSLQVSYRYAQRRSGAPKVFAVKIEFCEFVAEADQC
jgi:hypothetical protein